MFELLGITLVELQFFLLIIARISAMTFTLPIISANTIPLMFKAFLAVFIAIIVSTIVPPPSGLPVLFPILGFMAMKEVAVGLLIGMVAEFLFEAVKLAGFMIGRAMGLSMLTILDPNSEESVDSVAQLSIFIATLFMLVMNTHHFLLNVIFKSFYLIPLTEGMFNDQILRHTIEMSTQIFVIGLKIGAPLIVFLFMEKVIVAVFAKFSPDLHIIIISLPLSLLMGFYLLMYYWSYFAYAWNIYFEMYQEQVLTFLKLLH